MNEITQEDENIITPQGILKITLNNEIIIGEKGFDGLTDPDDYTRPLGTFQEDALQDHSHFGGGYNQKSRWEVEEAQYGSNSTVVFDVCGASGTGGMSGGKIGRDTRPKNITS